MDRAGQGSKVKNGFPLRLESAWGRLISRGRDSTALVTRLVHELLCAPGCWEPRGDLDSLILF